MIIRIVKNEKSGTTDLINPVFMGIFRYHTSTIPIQLTKLSGQPIICQLLSFIPRELANQVTETFKSDHY
jgi:hypothetical protein